MKKNLRKLRWREEDVISYLEYKLSSNIATDDELELYINYTYTYELIKNYTYKLLIKEMKRQYLNV